MTQAKDITDEAAFAAIRVAQDIMQRDYPHWANKPRDEVWSMLWDIQEALAPMPPKVVIAKLRSLIARKLIHGCVCGCRGDFYFVEKP